MEDDALEDSPSLHVTYVVNVEPHRPGKADCLTQRSHAVERTICVVQGFVGGESEGYELICCLP